MRMNRVVVREPARQLVDDGSGVGSGVHAGVVALRCPDERLGYAVRLRAFKRRRAGPMSRANRRVSWAV